MVIVILVAKRNEFDFNRSKDWIVNYIGIRHLVGASFPNIIFNTTVSDADMEQIADNIESLGMSPIFIEASQEFIDNSENKYLYIKQ